MELPSRLECHVYRATPTVTRVGDAIWLTVPIGDRSHGGGCDVRLFFDSLETALLVGEALCKEARIAQQIAAVEQAATEIEPPSVATA